MSDSVLRCEVCKQPIAVIDEDVLKTPLKGSMFKSLDPARNRPTFRETADWRSLICPYCRKRVCYNHDEILTDKGLTHVPDKSRKELDEQAQADITSKYTCPVCRRGFSSPQALAGHMNVHRRKES